MGAAVVALNIGTGKYPCAMTFSKASGVVNHLLYTILDIIGWRLQPYRYIKCEWDFVIFRNKKAAENNQRQST